ncbi:MAG: peptidoglycan-binding protein, partial [Candidatus Paceibacterota bacterium]
KAITVFDFNGLSPAVVGTVNEGAKTIALTVPYGTAVTALVPTITITGASVSPNTGVAANFTTPQTYTVTAADASTQAYVVTVTVASPASSSGGSRGSICKQGDSFSSTTGLPCTSYIVDTVCPTGHLFSATTGLSCTSYQNSPNTAPSILTPPWTTLHCSIFTNLLKLTSRGPGVKCLQESLNLLLDSQLSPDGIFGPKTEASVIFFQKSKGLVPDGIFGPKTKEKMNGAL